VRARSSAAWPDIVEPVEFSDGVTPRQDKGNTPILEIDQGTGVQTIYLKHLFNEHAAAAVTI